MNYVVQEVEPGVSAGTVYQPYGVVNDFFHYTGQECMLSGPYDTGKTFGALQKLLTVSWLYKNLHVLVVRKTYSSLKNSAIQTLFDKVLPDHPDNLDEYDLYGGGTPQSLTIKPTGSVWKFGGMDEPKRVLSAEYDFIFVPQAEELDINDWEQLLGRANGRAGHSPFPQIIGDCNPDVPSHWIVNRPSLKLFETRHLDNPTIYQYDEYGELVRDVHGNPIPTPGGRLRLKTLQSMTGLRYQRGYLGLWVGAEGVVYPQFDPKRHVIDPHPIPEEWKRYRSIDFGFNHPFVCQWWAHDRDNDRLYMYREMYMSGRTVNKHVLGDDSLKGILAYSEGENIVTTICDHDAEGVATLREHGIKTTPADKRIQVGLEKAQERLVVRDDGKPGVFFWRDSLVEEDESLKTAYKPTKTVEEFPGYVWASLGTNKIESAKDERPIKKNDHGMDDYRYLIMHFDGHSGGVVRAHKYA